MLRLLVLARGLALSTPSDALVTPPALIANTSHSVARLANTVAAVAASPALSSDEKSQAAAALRVTVSAYNAQGASHEELLRQHTEEAKANATRAAVAKSERISKEVEKGQIESSKQALDALRASEARAPVGTLLGDKARALEAKIVSAEADAAKQLDALDEVRELTMKKNSEVAAAERSLAEVKQKKADTAKEAEMAEQIAKEKRQESDAIEQQELDAGKKLADLRNEAEAMQEMVERKKQLSDATEKELADEAAAAQQAAVAAPLEPAAMTAAPVAAVVPAPVANATEANATASGNQTDFVLVKQENERLRREKEELKRQLEQLDGKKLEAENRKLAEEKAELQHEVAEKLAARAAVADTPAPAAPVKETNLRKKLVPTGFGA